MLILIKFRMRRGALIRGRRLIKGAPLISFFSKSQSHMIGVCNVSVPRKSQRDLVSLEELRDVTPLAGLGLLQKVGWALGNESADLLHQLPSRRSEACTKTRNTGTPEHRNTGTPEHSETPRNIPEHRNSQ